MAKRFAAIGHRLKQLRLALGNLSQADVCRAIDVIPSRWNQYETGDRKITDDVAARLRQRYGVTRDWIYDGDPSGLPVRFADKLQDAAE